MTTEELLAEIPNEGEELLEDIIADSPNAEEIVVEEPAEEGDNTPTEEDEDYKGKTSKRMQELLRDRKLEKERADALEERLLALEQSQPVGEEEIPDKWTRLFSTGDPEQDQEAYREWKELTAQDKEALKAEIMQELMSQSAEETSEEEERIQAYDAQMDEMEEGGKVFDRNELMKFIADRPIFRQDGQPDFETALELLEAKKGSNPAKSQARKALAAIKPQGGAERPWKTPEDLRGGFSSI